MDIKFLGYHADDRFIKSYRDRTAYMDLEKFYSAVNSINSGGCSCCKDEVTVYAVDVGSVPLIKPDHLSICVECVGGLPKELVIFNLGSNGAPPVLRIKDEVTGVEHEDK